MNDKPSFKPIVIAIVVALIIFIVWDTLFLAPMRAKQQSAALQETSNTVSTNLSAAGEANYTYVHSVKSVKIDTPKVAGRINLQGGKIDELILKDYTVTTAKDSPNIVLFKPYDQSSLTQGGAETAYYESGYNSSNQNVEVADDNSMWKANKSTLSVGSPVILLYTSGNLTFKKTISIDNNYMLTIEDTVTNNGSKAVSLQPWAYILKSGQPKVQNNFISHEGPVGFLNGSLEYISYKDMRKHNLYSYAASSGANKFIGFSDKYFLTALVPTTSNTSTFSYFVNQQGQSNYQADYLANIVELNKGQSYTNTTRLFAGPKAYQLLNSYAKKYSINKFEDSIDFGWFFFITKPFLKVLLFFYNHLHNFGYAMLCFTIVIRLLIFPISYMSFASMARMKTIQPKMQALKATCGNDMQKYNKALMNLYREEKVNPLAGCFPLIIQIPILFSIYKVIYNCIEMRHATFWWMKDLSAPDTLTVFNLFGLLPYSVPAFLNVGVWALLMGITMFIQQRLSVSTGNVSQMQQRMMVWLPIVMVFVLAGFPVGLLIYWCWSNIISIAQQLVINRFVKTHPVHHHNPH